MYLSANTRVRVYVHVEEKVDFGCDVKAFKRSRRVNDLTNEQAVCICSVLVVVLSLSLSISHARIHPRTHLPTHTQTALTYTRVDIHLLAHS